MQKILVPIIFVVLQSCQLNENELNNSGEFSNNKPYTPSHNATSKFNIKGMTCEIGCVRTVKSHLTKMDGVLAVDMDFDSAEIIDYSIIEFDTNLVSEADMKAEIESIANGIYQVVNINTN